MQSFSLRTIGPATSASSSSSSSSNIQPSILCEQQCSVWNCDGEILQETDVNVKSHCQLIQVYRRGLQQQRQQQKCSMNTKTTNETLNGSINADQEIITDRDKCGLCNIQ